MDPWTSEPSSWASSVRFLIITTEKFPNKIKVHLNLMIFKIFSSQETQFTHRKYINFIESINFNKCMPLYNSYIMSRQNNSLQKVPLCLADLPNTITFLFSSSHSSFLYFLFKHRFLPLLEYHINGNTVCIWNVYHKFV